MYEQLVIMLFMMILSTATIMLKQKLIPLVTSLLFLILGIIMFYPDTSLPYYPWILIMFAIYELILFLIAVLETW